MIQEEKSMGMTMTQKILAAHAGLESVVAGQLIEERKMCGEALDEEVISKITESRLRAEVKSGIHIKNQTSRSES